MTNLFKDTAVALRRMDYSETSQILVVFTRDHGKQRLIAKGIKRSTRTRPSVGIDLLESGQVVWSHREHSDATLGVLTEWRQENAFMPLRRHLANLYGAQYAAEITALMTEDGDPHPALFDALIETLSSLCDVGDSLSTVVPFQLTVLSEAGLRPVFAECVSCHRPTGGQSDTYLSSSQGGLICRDCEPAVIEKHRVHAEAVAGLLGGTWTRTGLREAFAALEYHIRNVVGKPTRLADFVVPPPKPRPSP